MTPRTAEEGRVAVGLEGFTWKPGMRDVTGDRLLASGMMYDDESGTDTVYPNDKYPPNPDDPATAGCLLELLGSACDINVSVGGVVLLSVKGLDERVLAETLGRACIAAAEKLGRWPGGEQ
jgi:hypothetical protein